MSALRRWGPAGLVAAAVAAYVARHWPLVAEPLRELFGALR